MRNVREERTENLREIMRICYSFNPVCYKRACSTYTITICVCDSVTNFNSK